MKHPFFSAPLRIFAHRGDCVSYPENTLPAFQSAVEMNVDCIETDVHVTRDGRCLISHDPTVERMTEGQGTIRSLDLEQIRKLDAGYRFSPDGGLSFPCRGKGLVLPSLEEALKTFPDMRFNVDLKDPSGEMVEVFVEELRRCNAVDRVLGASFHTRSLRYLRSLLPGLATSFSKREAAGLLLKQKLGALSLPPRPKGLALQVPERYGALRVVSPEFVAQVHRRGILVQVWTINRPEDMHRLFEMGVDGVMTDDPALLTKAQRS
jgi:glycerophosphoryl diester phosphodiesterase